MAALTATTPTQVGVVVTLPAVTASDTVAASIIGSRGAILIINNGGAGVDNMTISDNGLTPGGNPLPGSQITTSVTNGTQKSFLILPGSVNPNTGVVTITHSGTVASITYQLYSLG